MLREPGESPPIQTRPQPTPVPPPVVRHVKRRSHWAVTASGVVIAAHLLLFLLLAPKPSELESAAQVSRFMGVLAGIVLWGLVGMGLGWLVRRRGNIGVLVGCVLLLALFDVATVSRHFRRERAREAAADAAAMREFVEDARRQRVERHSKGEPLEAARVKDLAERFRSAGDREGSDEQRVAAVVGEWMSHVASLGQEYDNAVAAAIEVGFAEPEKLTTAEQFDLLQTRIREARRAADVVSTEFVEPERTLRAKLEEAGCGAGAIAACIRGLLEGDHLRLGRELRTLDAAILTARAAQATLLKDNLGDWSRDEDGMVVFSAENADALIKSYNGEQETINAAAERQQEIFKELAKIGVRPGAGG